MQELESLDLVNPKVREWLVRYGTFRSALIVTLVSTLSSLAITYLIILIYRHYGIVIHARLMLSIAGLATLLIAFPVSLFAIDTFLRLHAMETRMRRLATYDTLTRLLVRHAFMKQAFDLYHQCSQKRGSCALFLCDLDDFKQINDRYGHAVGDRVLRSFGKILNEHLPVDGIAGRLGGEEFGIFLPCRNREDALEFSERLHRSVRSHRVSTEQGPVAFSFSAGLMILTPDGSSVNIDEPLHHADIALYAAKRNGKNQTILFDPSLALTMLK